MEKVSLIARIVVVEGREAELEQAIAACIEASEEEPGLEVYSAHADDGKPGEYYFFEVYRSAEDRLTHSKGPRMTDVLPALRSLIAGTPEITTLRPVAAKGIEL